MIVMMMWTVTAMMVMMMMMMNTATARQKITTLARVRWALPSKEALGARVGVASARHRVPTPALRFVAR